MHYDNELFFLNMFTSFFRSVCICKSDCWLLLPFNPLTGDTIIFVIVFFSKLLELICYIVLRYPLVACAVILSMLCILKPNISCLFCKSVNIYTYLVLHCFILSDYKIALCPLSYTYPFILGPGDDGLLSLPPM